MDTEELVEVYTTNQELEAEVVRGRLEAEGIGARISGANQAGFAGVLEVKVYVKVADELRARDIIQDGELNKAAEGELGEDFSDDGGTDLDDEDEEVGEEEDQAE